jgi:hypothetical protein
MNAAKGLFIFFIHIQWDIYTIIIMEYLQWYIQYNIYNDNECLLINFLKDGVNCLLFEYFRFVF